MRRLDQMSDEEFVRFYLDQEQEGSNIYFEERIKGTKAKEVTVFYQIVPGRVPKEAVFARRFWLRFAVPGVLMAGAAAVFLFFAGSSFFYTRTASFSESAVAYDRIVSVQNAIFAFRFRDAVFGLHEAADLLSQHDARRMSLSAAFSSFLSFVSSGENNRHESVEAAKTAVEAAARAVEEGMGTLFALSRTALFADDGTEKGIPSAGAVVADAATKLKDASGKLAHAQDAVAAIPEEDFTDAERKAIAALMPRLSLVAANVKQLSAELDFFSWVLGVDQPRHFVVALQDRTVARATGGFVGAFAAIDTAGGFIQKIAVYPADQLDGNLAVRVIPPFPVQYVSTLWSFRNANWFLDFPLSAQKLAYFYEKSGGNEVDGVFALNERALAHLLDVTGPLMPAGAESMIVSSFNMGELFRFGTEVDLLQKEKEQTFAMLERTLNALARAVWELSEERMVVALHSFDASFLEKDALAWVADRTFEGMLARLGWAGAVSDDEGNKDYLAVIASDIGRVPRGVTTENVFKEIRVSEDGTLTASVVIELSREQADISAEGAVHGGLRYVRVYAPKGAELQEASGFSFHDAVLHIDYARERFSVDADIAAADATRSFDEYSDVDIFEESEKTVFGGWTDANDARIILTFTLPFRLAPGEFTSVFQKQPGVGGKLHFVVHIPDHEGFEYQDNFLSDKTVTVTIP